MISAALVMHAIMTYSVMLSTFLCACQAALELYMNCVELEDERRTSKVACKEPLDFHHSFPTPTLSKISFSKKHNSKLDRACFPAELY